MKRNRTGLPADALRPAAHSVEGAPDRTAPPGERLRRALYDAADAMVDLLDAAPRRAAAPPPGEEPLLFDVRTAAATLGISVTALRRFERSGALASVRMGRRLLFRAEIVRQFATAHESLREHG